MIKGSSWLGDVCWPTQTYEEQKEESEKKKIISLASEDSTDGLLIPTVFYSQEWILGKVGV